MSIEKRKNDKITFNKFKHRTVSAIILTLVTSVTMIPGMATYLPIHQNDAIGIPILLFPFIWTALFLYSYLAKSIRRVWFIMISLTTIHVACVYIALMS